MSENKIQKIVPKQSIAQMTGAEREHFGANKVLGEYALLEQLIELSPEPPCPAAKKQRVVTEDTMSLPTTKLIIIKIFFILILLMG